MEEKCMVNDVLQNSKEFVKLLDDTILESDNLEFRGLVTLIRNSAESFEGNLSKLAKAKGYYIASSKADESEIIALRKMFL